LKLDIRLLGTCSSDMLTIKNVHQNSIMAHDEIQSQTEKVNS